MRKASFSLVETLEKWATAIKEDRPDDALDYAQSVKRVGEVVIIHPQFMRQFNEQCPQANPRESLENMSQLLTCVAAALKTDRQSYRPGSYADAFANALNDKP